MDYFEAQDTLLRCQSNKFELSTVQILAKSQSLESSGSVSRAGEGRYNILEIELKNDLTIRWEINYNCPCQISNNVIENNDVINLKGSPSWVQESEENARKKN